VHLQRGATALRDGGDAAAAALALAFALALSQQRARRGHVVASNG
jgi:hypothetical protein